MRQDLNFVSTGGLGPPGGSILDVLRTGFRQGTTTLNIYHARTVWDAYILLTMGIYDLPLASNPLSAVVPREVYNWMTTKVEEEFRVDLALNPTGPDGVAGTGDDGKVTIIRFTFRNDLTFHNGQPVIPNDIIKSYLSYRDVPQGGFGGAAAMSQLITARQIGSNIVELVHDGHSFFHKINSILPVLPVSLWDTNGDGFICGTSNLGSCQGRAADATTAVTYDPLLGLDGVAGTGDETLIGSGPFMCVDRDTGQVGGGCSENNLGNKDVGGTVDPGGRFLLTRYDKFHRCCPESEDSSLGRFSWADVNDDGKVDITDIAEVAVRFGLNDPYWDHSIFGVRDNEVDIAEVSTAAFYFDHGLITPFETLEGMDPDIEPFR